MTDRDETSSATFQATFQTVVNDEEQYSIWPSDREPPTGWRPVGVTGSKESCLAWIGEHWADLRPRSLREAMDGRG